MPQSAISPSAIPSKFSQWYTSAKSTNLAKAFGPKGSETIRPQSGMYSNGDGLAMGLEVGAGVDYLGCDIQSNAIVGDKSSVMTLTWLTCGAINVNVDGKRFHDEAGNA